MPDPISWTTAAPFYLAALLFGYLLGSIPFGLVLTRFAGMGDVREYRLGKHRCDKRFTNRKQKDRRTHIVG